MKPKNENEGLFTRLKIAYNYLAKGKDKPLNVTNVEEILNKYFDKVKEITTENRMRGDSNDAMDEIYIFDWHRNFTGTVDRNERFMIVDNVSFSVGADGKEIKAPKIAMTPKDALKELEVVPNPFSLELLDEKIQMMEDKKEFFNANQFPKRRVIGVLECLNNRKKYVEHREFFEQFQNTTDAKIDVLLEKYPLVMKTADLFVPTLPNEAVKIMKAYDKEMKSICGKKTNFYVIAEESDFKKKDEKDDPILLAQSPFGFYWQVLGAWDKEMLLLSEL